MVVSKNPKAKVMHEDWCPYARRIKKKYRLNVSKKDGYRMGYHDCDYCGGLHGYFIEMQKYPNINGRSRRKLRMSYDRKTKALCFRTEIGFWKVLKADHDGLLRLYHLNTSHFDPNERDTVLMRRFFHRQGDVKPVSELSGLIDYIYKHDQAKQQMQGNYRNLPKTTKQQRKYYRQAQKKARRKEMKRVDELFKQLENERKEKRYG